MSGLTSLFFQRGIELLFVWELFWLVCWIFTAQFMWTGEYNSFNEGGWIAKSVPVILFCSVLSIISTVLTGRYLFVEDAETTRFGLFVACAIMLVIAVLFVVGGVPIMVIDILAMGYATKKTWEHYQEAPPVEYEIASKKKN